MGDCTQFLNTNRLTSERRVLKFGEVGHWPSFILIVHHKPLSDIGSKHELSFHFYADDTQLWRNIRDVLIWN